MTRMAAACFGQRSVFVAVMIFSVISDVACNTQNLDITSKGKKKHIFFCNTTTTLKVLQVNSIQTFFDINVHYL